MKCGLCETRYNKLSYLPKVLPCSHVFCLECLNKLFEGGEIVCPECRIASTIDPNELQTHKFIMDKLIELTVTCAMDKHVDASRFCPVHVKPICDECTCVLPQCQMIAIEDENQVRHILYDAFKKYTREQLTCTQRLTYDNRYKLSISELVSLLESISISCESLVCIKCQVKSNQWIDVENLTVYCQVCYDTAKTKDDSLQGRTINAGDDWPKARNAIMSSVRSKLRKIDFYNISYEQLRWLASPPEQCTEFFKQAKSIAELECAPRLNAFPETFFCPNCQKIMYRDNHSLRKLLCSSAFHAICEQCAAGYPSQSVKCPLDENVFCTNAASLQIIAENHCEPVRDDPEKSNHILIDPLSIDPAPDSDEEIPRGSELVGSGMFLQRKGIRIPKFAPSINLPVTVPRQNLVTADRYFRVLPAREPLHPPTAEEQAFIKPWNISKVPNQVEALTLQCFARVQLWGVGLANPILAGNQCIVQWIRIYIGETAAGNYTEIPLLNVELQGRKDVITDIYFSAPYDLQPFAPVTIKIKLGKALGVTEDVYLFHGNHIGKCEDWVGKDGIGWQAMETKGVDEGETNSGQQQFIGPILRMIYEKIDLE